MMKSLRLLSVSLFLLATAAANAAEPQVPAASSGAIELGNTGAAASTASGPAGETVDQATRPSADAAAAASATAAAAHRGAVPGALANKSGPKTKEEAAKLQQTLQDYRETKLRNAANGETANPATSRRYMKVDRASYQQSEAGN